MTKAIATDYRNRRFTIAGGLRGAKGSTGSTGATGATGATGDTGSFEDEPMYAKRVDFISDDLLYRGEAAVGSSESAPVWRVRRITFGAVDGDVTEQWAGGTANFDKTWDGRLGFTYS